MTEPSDIAQRKADHIDLCATGDVGFREKTTLLEEVELIHDSVPELGVDEVDTTTTLFGKRLSMPLVIASMTGGTEKARAINFELARIAEEEGLGFGLGSQRPMLRFGHEKDSTYDVRSVAKNVLLLGNIGAVQAAASGVAAIADLAGRVGADALCLHLNPAQEIVQPEGDRDFRGVLDVLGTMNDELPIPVLAKETGCGVGLRAAFKIAKTGVRHLDVSGAGGTSWVAVEMQRAEGDGKSLGRLLREWGVPTAASVIHARLARPRFQTIIATGGLSSGVDVARAVALGASAGGIARPVLQAFVEGGVAGAKAFIGRVRAELTAVMVLTGSRTLDDLARADRILGPSLARWESHAHASKIKKRGK
jgi:isopentenyl-diphosphate delta-isomerase